MDAPGSGKSESRPESAFGTLANNPRARNDQMTAEPMPPRSTPTM